MASGVWTIRSTTCSHPEQRRTIPGPCVKASREPISPSLPQFAHSVGSAVISMPKISYSKPAVAFASSISSRLISVISSISASCWTKPFCADLTRIDSDFDQPIRGRFDHQGRSTDEDLNTSTQWTCHFFQHAFVNAPGVPLPASGLGTGQGVKDLKPTVSRTQFLQFVVINDVFKIARAVQQSRRVLGL